MTLSARAVLINRDEYRSAIHWELVTPQRGRAFYQSNGQVPSRFYLLALLLVSALGLRVPILFL
jgi:hypothetical protein